MPRENFLAFDDYIEDTQSTYSSTELNNALGAYDAFVLQVVTDDVVGATAITVQLEVSSDGRRWTSKNVVPEVNGATLASGTTNNAQGWDPGTTGPAPSLVRLRVQLTNFLGGVTRAHVKIYVRAGEAVGPFQPNHVGGCILWLRTDMGVKLSGANVTTWADQSGSRNDAAAGLTAPTFGVASNGFPKIAGTAGGYLTGSFATSVTAYTLFAVATYPALSNMATFAGTDAGFNVNSGFAQFTEVGTGIVARTGLAAGGFVSATTADTSSLTKTSIYSTSASDGGSVDLLINGASKATTGLAGSALVACSNYIVFGLGLPLQYNLTGDLFEVAIYNRLLSAPERALVHGYLGGRYGIPIA